ncbi:MAG: NAD(P)/FAD-dependent oxidoreductase [Pelovirga sp.]
MPDFDLIVIGGGAAGCFAAGVAANQGARVLLLEKNPGCGAKLLITGKGRCNITHQQEDARLFCDQFGRQGKALLTALYRFGVDRTIDFFQERGLPLQQERGGRMFPATGGAPEVQQLLVSFVRESGVDLRTGCTVQELLLQGDRVRAVKTTSGEYAATAVVVATGGLSYPETGCTGDGYRWATASGHRLVTPQPALVPLQLAADWTADVLNLNLRNIRISARQEGRIIAERFGEAFFTRRGIGGPIVLDMSSAVRSALDQGPVELLLDLKPAVSRDLFDRRLQRELATHNNRAFGKALGQLLPQALIPLFIRLSGIAAEKKCHSVSRAERLRLLDLFKEWPLKVTALDTPQRAIITAGGIAISDIDMRTMRSRKIANLYFAGEVIDLDGPTGGYNLQLCWSTGYLAGISAVTAADQSEPRK